LSGRPESGILGEMDAELTAALDRAADLLRTADRVAVLTGAGVSAESGVPTFRASDGLWEGHPIEKVATPMGFRDDPGLVWQFYNARRANVRTVRPNPGHLALAAMERHWAGRFDMATQNVGGLHQQAGSVRVHEIHGSLRRTRCTKCYTEADRGLETLDAMPKCPDCGGLLRPAIVWFHENLPEDVWTSAQGAVGRCNVLLVVGTSAVVYPAAGLIPLARMSGASVIECNLTRTDASGKADVGLYGPSGLTLPALCERLGIPLEGERGA
jgi:NAD-dependent deacetylase